MAPQKHARSSLGKTAKYYRDNPEARKKKAITDTKINKRKDQVKKRNELAKKRRALKKKWVNMKWKDIAHTKSWLRLKSSSKNRWSKSDAKWDRNARWWKKTKK